MNTVASLGTAINVQNKYIADLQSQGALEQRAEYKADCLKNKCHNDSLVNDPF